jgi:hypothetical protein
MRISAIGERVNAFGRGGMVHNPVSKNASDALSSLNVLADGTVSVGLQIDEHFKVEVLTSEGKAFFSRNQKNPSDSTLLVPNSFVLHQGKLVGTGWKNRDDELLSEPFIVKGGRIKFSDNIYGEDSTGNFKIAQTQAASTPKGVIVFAASDQEKRGTLIEPLLFDGKPSSATFNALLLPQRLAADIFKATSTGTLFTLSNDPKKGILIATEISATDGSVVRTTSLGKIVPNENRYHTLCIDSLPKLQN